MLLLIAAIMLMLALMASRPGLTARAARRIVGPSALDVASKYQIWIDREIDQTAGFLDGISNAPRSCGGDTEFFGR